ncbi:unnamed protein product [Tilletia controversa]|nr:unnamed protein product [Tilletia controversa]
MLALFSCGRRAGGPGFEHFTPLLQFLKSHPQHSHVKTPANDKGKARDLSHTNSPIRALVLYALGALFALYTIHAAPIIEEDDDDENKEESAAGGGGGRGCLGLLPAPTWAEVNLTPIWRARKRRRENQEASSTSTSTPTPPQPRTRQTQTRSGGPPAPKRRSNWRPPKPLTDPDDIAAAVLSKQRRLEGLSGTIPVHPDEGRVLIAREVYERVVLKMPELLVEWVGEAEVREEDGIGLVDEVVFVLRALCLHERKETGTAAFTHTHTQQTGGVFRILARPPPSRATMSTGVGSDHQAAQHFFGPLWHSSSRFAERVSEAPTSLGGYLVVKIGEMRTFHLALSRADALRLAVAHRIGGFGPIATSFLRERAREHLFRAPPSYDGDGGTEEEREGMIRLAKGEFDVIGMPELSADRGLLVAAEAKAVDAIGSGMRDENPSVAAAAIADGGKERGTAFSPNAVEFVKMFSFGTNLGQHQPQEEGGQGSPTDASVRHPSPTHSSLLLLDDNDNDDIGDPLQHSRPQSRHLHTPAAMLDHILGRPSTRLRRAQVLCVLSLGILSLFYGDRDGPRRLQWIRWLNRHAKSFTPWQIVIGTVTAVYAVRNLDHLLGFGAPEPLARMYSRSFYRTTWINTALDAGFATAMPIRPQWLKDILALLFSGYYLVYANEADEKLRKYRAFCTVEMMRETWHKTTNPYIRLATWIHRPQLKIAKEVLLPRPTIGKHASRPTVAWLYFDGDERSLRAQTELILDIPGGGFISMDPRHHEERLRALAKQTRRPVLALNYCKAPEFPFPFALEECYDAYRTLYETRGAVIGMGKLSSSAADLNVSTASAADRLALEKSFRIILSGDSAGGNLATGVMMKIIEYPQPHIQVAYAEQARRAIESQPASLSRSQTGKDRANVPALPKPIAILLAYPSLNFAYSSWMKPEHIRVLRQQSEVNLQTMREESQARLDSAAARPQPGHKPSPGQSPLNPNRSGRRPSLNARVGLPSSLEEERAMQLRAAGVGGSTPEQNADGGAHNKEAQSTRTPRDRALGLVPPSGVPEMVTSPSAILNTFMGKAQSVIRRSTSRSSMKLPSNTASASKDSTASAATSGTTDAKKRPGPKRDRSYSSLAGQAQMHLVERARFAEADPSASEDETASYTIGTFGDEDENRDASAVDSLDEAQRQYHQDVMALTASKMGPSSSAIRNGNASTDGEEDVDGTSSGYNTDHENRAHEEQQKALRAATDAADAKMASARAKRGQRAYGTRLTMTSMAGYFQDRILTQSMMRAMAILYIGPKYQPDFEHDYYLSPIVAPAALLAEFPPCLFVCGEKDPICDDTVVMAGRIREAKTAKKRELERRRAGPSARFGEGLRMSSAKASAPVRDPIEDESPEDWVHMRIIEGWSHGFLQMSALMPEAKEVITFLGVWMSETFEDWNARNGIVSPPAVPTQIYFGENGEKNGGGGGLSASPMLGSSSAAAAGANATDALSKGLQRRPSEGDDDDDEPLSFTTNIARRSPISQNGGGSPLTTGGSPTLRSPGLGAGAGQPRFFGGANGERSTSPMPRASSAQIPAAAGGAAAPTSASSNGKSPVSAPTSLTQSNGNGPAPPPLSSAAGIATSPNQPLPNVGKPSSAGAGGMKPVPAPVRALQESETNGTRITASALANNKGVASGSGSGSGAGTPIRRLSFVTGTQQSEDERERRGSSSNSGGGTALEEKYRSMLVQESDLLQRRRGEAVFGLGDSGAVHDESDEEGEGEAADPSR